MAYKTIAGHELTPGSVVRDSIAVPGTGIRVPCILLCGDRPGPTVLITAGVHSAEFVGIRAAIELSRELTVKELSGTVMVVPLCNSSGFARRTMSMVYEDGKNLNRVFPGDIEGTPAQRLAAVLFDTFIRNADAYIDLHCGDGYETLTPFCYYVGATPAAAVSAAMALRVAVPWVVNSRCHEGGAYNVASVRGIPSVLIERGCLGQATRDEIDADKADVRNVLRYLGVLGGQSVTHPKTVLREYDIVGPVTGLWYPDKQVGEPFAAGERLGRIEDCFGSVLHTVTAPEDGVLLYQCSWLNVLEKGPMIAYGVPEHDLA